MKIDMESRGSDIVDILSVHCSVEEGDERIRFDTSLMPSNGAFRDKSFTLWLGSIRIATVRIPILTSPNQTSLGTTYINVDDIWNLNGYDFIVTEGESLIGGGRKLHNVSGNFAEAVTIADDTTFRARIQLHHSRFTSRALLLLGSKATYQRSINFTTRAAALTVIAHRVLEKNFSSINEIDQSIVDWLIPEAVPLINAGDTKISAKDNFNWEDVRWTVSLATVTAYLCLMNEDLHRAREMFQIVTSHIDLVRLSKVSGLNFINGFFFYGILSMIAGDEAEATRSLYAGVTSYPNVVSSQNMIENVWVIGDLINVAKVSRQCFIALARYELIETGSRKIIDDNTFIDLSQLQSPVSRMIASGRAKGLAGGMSALSTRFLTV